jgi:hypothetical protein
MIITRQEPKDVPDRVVCNRCKAEACFHGADIFRAGHFLPVSFDYGYASTHFGDGAKINFHLCEECTAWLTTQFQISAVVS